MCLKKLLNEKQKGLFELLLQIPVDMELVRHTLSEGEYSAEDVSLVGTAFAEECFGEVDDSDPEHYVLVQDHSPFIYGIVSLFLEYGLDPNAVFDGENIMHCLRWIGWEYVAADTLRLLLDHGGDPCLEVDNEDLFHSVSFDVSFDRVEQFDKRSYDALVHFWFVLIGYAGKEDLLTGEGEPMFRVFKQYKGDYWDERVEFDLAELRNHRDYTFFLSTVSSHNDPWSLHIVDKRTQWEVARW